jgi:outer membrane protein OmpA-like peptidoglycan-associated protein
MAKYIIVLITLFIYLKGAAKSADTIKVYFGKGASTLNDDAIKMLDSLVYKDVLTNSRKYGIIGYADYVGNQDSNMVLSKNRAENVRAYLEQMGCKKEDIEVVQGKGEIKRQTENETGYKEDRRVDIILGEYKKAEPLFDISKLKKDETLRLEHMQFMPGSPQMLITSFPELQKLSQIMKENPKLRISIEGHICCQKFGNTDSLSTWRAKAVYDSLVKNGVNKQRMIYKGLGMTRPLKHPEQSAEDERLNRRVEIRILDK